jgi:predicted RNA binding protein YcfA (HicA-like mRNA interferase family)
MGKIKRLSGQKVIKTLQKMGFESIRQRGSHVVLKKTTIDGVVGCVVPLHKELAIGTLSSILRQAKLSNEVFMEHL